MQLLNNHWRTRRQLGPEPYDPDLRSLLFASGSLTRRLRRRCGDTLELKLLNQQWQHPWRSEQLLLDLTAGRYALVREVSIGCGTQPLLYARTLLPPRALRGAARRFLTIGRRPLGALLFGAPGRLPIRQLRRDYACLDGNSPIQQRISELLGAMQQSLWARRTVYETGSVRFAIIEVFLPAAGQR